MIDSWSWVCTTVLQFCKLNNCCIMYTYAQLLVKLLRKLVASRTYIKPVVQTVVPTGFTVSTYLKGSSADVGSFCQSFHTVLNCIIKMEL
jgi:hypothetical protein